MKKKMKASLMNYFTVLVLISTYIFMGGCASMMRPWEVETTGQNQVDETFLIIAINHDPSKEITYIDYFKDENVNKLSAGIAEGMKEYYPRTKTPDDLLVELEKSGLVEQFNNQLNDVILEGLEDQRGTTIPMVNISKTFDEYQTLIETADVDNVVFVFWEKPFMIRTYINIFLSSSFVDSNLLIEIVNRNGKIKFAKAIRKRSGGSPLSFIGIGPSSKLTEKSANDMISLFLFNYVPNKIFYGKQLKKQMEFGISSKSNMGLIGLYTYKNKMKIVFPNPKLKKVSLKIYDTSNNVIYSSIKHKTTRYFFIALRTYDPDSKPFKSSMFKWKYVDNHGNKIPDGKYYIQLEDDTGKSPMYPFEYDFAI